MTLLDTSILITYFRKRSPIIKRFFDTHALIITGLARAEVLCGATDRDDRLRLIDFLDEFALLPIKNEIWDALGDNLMRLRRAGIAVPFPDALIATQAALNALPVWSFDAHYALMQGHIPGLRLFSGPGG